MEQYRALFIMAERQNQKQVLVENCFVSNMRVHLAIHSGGFRQWDHRVCDHKEYDKLHF